MNDETILHTEIPELPNFLTLLHRNVKAPWAQWIYHWESLIFSVLIALLLALLFYAGTRRKRLIPSRFQNFLESIIDGLDKVILGILGPQGAKHLPFLGSLFIYILTMNWFGLIPLMKSPTNNVSITAALAICVFVYVQYYNFKQMGFFGFFYHMAGSPKTAIGWLMAPFLLPLEIITQIARPVTLTLRLSGNILGEDILIGAFALLGVMILPTLIIPFGIPLQLPFLFLGMLTSLMQALVFTLLSTVYILLSTPQHEEETKA